MKLKKPWLCQGFLLSINLIGKAIWGIWLHRHTARIKGWRITAWIENRSTARIYHLRAARTKHRHRIAALFITILRHIGWTSWRSGHGHFLHRHHRCSRHWLCRHYRCCYIGLFFHFYRSSRSLNSKIVYVSKKRRNRQIPSFGKKYRTFQIKYTITTLC